MKNTPDLVFIIDTNYESLAIAESVKLRIPIKQTDADTNAVYSTVNTYHPYVAKIYIEQNGYPVPPQFQYISKP